MAKTDQKTSFSTGRFSVIDSFGLLEITSVISVIKNVNRKGSNLQFTVVHRKDVLLVRSFDDTG
jgi:hypothetical protein